MRAVTTDFDHAEPGSGRMHPEHPQHAEHARLGRGMLEVPIEGLVRLSRDDLSPDSALGELGVERPRFRVRFSRFYGAIEQGGELSWIQLEGTAALLPKEVAVVNQRGQLIDSLTQTPFRPKLVEEHHDFAQHEEGVPISRVLSGLRQGCLNSGEGRTGDALKHQVERGGPKVLH